MLRTKGESPDEDPKEPPSLHYAAKRVFRPAQIVGEPDNVFQTAPTLDETIAIRRDVFLDLVNQRYQDEAKQVRRQVRAIQNSTASQDHYHAWTAMRNATSERDNAEEKLESIANAKSDRQKAIKYGELETVRKEHRDMISVLDRDKSEIEARLSELNDKIRPLEREEAKRSRALDAVRREQKENEKAMAKVEDKAAIIGGLKDLLYLGVDGIAEWRAERRELFLDVIADNEIDDILCLRQAIREGQEAM